MQSPRKDVDCSGLNLYLYIVEKDYVKVLLGAVES